MTVPSTSRRAGPFTGTGILTSYPFTFKVFEKADVQVTIADTNGLETVLVTDSTVLVTLNIDQDATPGGSVQYAVGGVATALPSGYMLAITGEGLAFNQPAELPQGGNFDPGVIESALDRLEMQIQLIREAVDRALQVGVTTSTDFDVALPSPVALTLLGWAADGLSLVNYSPDVDSAAGLQVRLANTASQVDGASMLAYNAALAYASGVGLFLNNIYARTAAEISAGVTPSNYFRPPGDVRRYGAVGDYTGPGVGTDDSAAIRRAFLVIQAQGGGVMDFGSLRYRIFSDGVTTLLADLSTCRGVTLEARGAELVVDRTFSGSTAFFLWQFSACNGVHFGNFVGSCTQAQPAGQHTSRGAQWANFLQGCTDITSRGLKLSNFRIGWEFQRANGDPLSYASSGIKLGVTHCYQVGYPLTTVRSGYDLEAVLITEECGRSYFPQGCKRNRIKVTSKNHQASVDCLLATTLGEGPDDLELDYTNTESTGADISLDCVRLEIQDSDVYVATIRNVKVRQRLSNLDSGKYLGFGFGLAKRLASGVLDTVDRGHSVEMIGISGTIAAASTNQRSIAFANLGTWGAGENLRNVSFDDLRFAGTGQPNFTLTSLKDECRFNGYYYNGQTNITANDTSAVNIINSTSVVWAKTGVVCFHDGNALITPATLTANQNNWSPTGITYASDIDIEATAARDITGILAPAYEGKKLFIFNNSNFTLTFRQNSGSSSVGNKLNLKGSADLALLSNTGFMLRYKGTPGAGIWNQIGY